VDSKQWQYLRGVWFWVSSFLGPGRGPLGSISESRLVVQRGFPDLFSREVVLEWRVQNSPSLVPVFIYREERQEVSLGGEVEGLELLEVGHTGLGGPRPNLNKNNTSH